MVENIYNWSDSEIEKRLHEYQNEIAPHWFPRRYGQSWKDHALELAILGSHERYNIYGWSDEEIKRRSRNFQDAIAPTYYQRYSHESWRQFDLRMALMSMVK